MVHTTRLLKQVGDHFKRKYGFTYKIGDHPMTGDDDGSITIWDDNDEPYYAASLSVSLDPDENLGEWDIHVHQGRKGTGNTLTPDASVSQVIREAEKLLRRESDMLPKRAARTAKPWSKLPKGWTDKSVDKFWGKMTGDVKHKVTKCMKEMEGKVDNTGAFCGSLADKVEGNTKWRGKKKAIDLSVFNRQHPHHRDLDHIDSSREKVRIGNGRFDIDGRRAGLLVRAGLVDIVEDRFGRYLELTRKGHRSLDDSRDTWEARMAHTRRRAAMRPTIKFHTLWRHQVESKSLVKGLPSAETRTFIKRLEKELSHQSPYDYVTLSDWKDNRDGTLTLKWYTGGEDLMAAGNGSEAIKSVAKAMGYVVMESR